MVMTLLARKIFLSHRNGERGFQFLTLMKTEPLYDARWQSRAYFVVSDGAVTDIRQKYFTRE